MVCKWMRKEIVIEEKTRRNREKYKEKGVKQKFSGRGKAKVASKYKKIQSNMQAFFKQ